MSARQISREPARTRGREACNQTGEGVERERFGEWFAFLDPTAPNHALKTVEARRYLETIEPSLAERGFGRGGARVLDVGGGTGRLALPLAHAGHHVTLVENSPKALQDAERAIARAKLENIDLTCGNAYELSGLPEADYDAALALELLCYLEEPELALAEIARRVKPGGPIFVSVEAWPAALSVVPELSWREIATVARTRILHREEELFVRYYDRDAVLELAVAAGLEVVALEATHHALEGIFAASVELEALSDSATAEAVLELERFLGSDPATAPLGRAWFAMLRKAE